MYKRKPDGENIDLFRIPSALRNNQQLEILQTEMTKQTYSIGSSMRLWLKVVFRLMDIGSHKLTVSWKAMASNELSSEKDIAVGERLRKSPATSQVHDSF